MDVQSMEQFWETYSERYMASDLDAVAALYEVPFLAVRDKQPIHLTTGDELRSHLAGLMEAYRDAGAKQAAIVDLRIVQLDGASCLATVGWSARSADGAVLREFTVSYQMLRRLSGWTILSYTYHAD